MIRFLIDTFRRLPGPFPKARLLVADIADEVLDIAKEVWESRKGASHQEGSVEASGAVDGPLSDGSPAADSAPGAGGDGGDREVAGEPADQSSIALTGAGGGDSLVDRVRAAVSDSSGAKSAYVKTWAALYLARRQNRGFAIPSELVALAAEAGIPVSFARVRAHLEGKLAPMVRVRKKRARNGRTVHGYRLTDEGMRGFEDAYLGGAQE